MTFRVEFTDSAQRDAQEVYRYIAGRSSRNAARWFTQLRRTVESLAEFPARCPLAPESAHFDDPIRQRLFGPYRILFVIRQRSVYVLHIRHGARRPMTAEEFLEA